MNIQLSRLAQADLDDIRDYTVETWGRAQWLKYFRGMAAAFKKISVDPMAGRSRDLLGPGLRSLPYEKHLIFFAPIPAAGGAAVILRIIHQRRYLPALAYYDDLDSA
ncbi:MAG: type II toxin-antitoxin system RelE/ParE family toxin [Alphaproteobacteria bacterium]|jgi:toxin ParE1/3/4